MRLPLNAEGSRLLRQLIRQRFAWPGGHEIFFVTPDGAIICVPCARHYYRAVARDRRDRRNTGWLIRWADTTESLIEPTDCDQCGTTLSYDE